MAINNDGTVNQEAVTSSYRIVNGNGNEYLRASYDESLGKEIKYSMFFSRKNGIFRCGVRNSKNQTTR